MEVGLEPTARHAADLGLISVVVTDACGAGNSAAAERSLASLATAGDAILTDIATITDLLETGKRHNASDGWRAGDDTGNTNVSIGYLLANGDLVRARTSGHLAVPRAAATCGPSHEKTPP